MKKSFTIVEIVIVFFLILLTAALVIPNLLEDNKKLDIISKWKHSYQNIEYVFSAIAAQATKTDELAFQKAKSNSEREQILYDFLNPYFRLKSTIDVKNYKTSYLNGEVIKPDDDYYFSNLHQTSSGAILGIKWRNIVMGENTLPFATLLYDLNGLAKPNKWGYDIFGVDMYRDRIEPVGKSDDEFLLKSDCSKKGKGLACSYYYYIYGGELN